MMTGVSLPRTVWSHILFTRNTSPAIFQSLRYIRTSSSLNAGSIDKNYTIKFASEDLVERGLISDVFPPSRASTFSALTNSHTGLYCGFDPTAASLHLGHLATINVLLHAQRSGHKPIIVMGGATGQIGDPSGRSTERPQLTQEDAENNVLGLTENVTRIFDNHARYIAPNDCILQPLVVLNNLDFYKDQNLISFLSYTCRHIRLGNMLKKQNVKRRLEEPLGGMSLTEFLYQVMQASDWLHLYKHHGCKIQVGGNDQTGNIASGFELIREITEDYCFGLLVPLITDSSGKKLGKSTGNAVWLDPQKSSPFYLYQHLLNVSDEDVETFLKLLTFLSMEEIDDVMKDHEKSPKERAAQKRLAKHVTLLVHGVSGLKSAHRGTEVLFSRDPQLVVAALADMRPGELRGLVGPGATSSLPYNAKMNIIQLLVKIGGKTGLLSGKTTEAMQGEADSLLKSGGVYVDQKRVEDSNVTLDKLGILKQRDVLLRIGKKKYAVVEWLQG